MNDFRLFAKTWYLDGDSHRCAFFDNSINGTSPIAYAVDKAKYVAIPFRMRAEIVEYELLQFFKYHNTYYVGVASTTLAREIAASDYKRMKNNVLSKVAKQELTLFDYIEL